MNIYITTVYKGKYVENYKNNLSFFMVHNLEIHMKLKMIQCFYKLVDVLKMIPHDKRNIILI